MKCPKCGYLGFETSDRCRNCGYDFSLSVTAGPREELPLRPAVEPAGPLVDFDLGSSEGDTAGALDLDRLIGAPEADTPAERRNQRVTPQRRSTPSAVRGAGEALPLFPSDGGADVPVRPPRPAGQPLSVRRTTPEIARTRSRTITPAPPVEPPMGMGEDGLLPGPAAADAIAGVARVTIPTPTDHAHASRSARLIAAAIDLVLLAAIDGAVVYLTLALARLERSDLATLPLIPLVLFFAILAGGYLIAFVAASGQTIGKMITGIRVIGDDGRRVDIRGACLRAAGCLVSLLTAGLGYLPALLNADGRALHDRIAGTRVVRAR